MSILQTFDQQLASYSSKLHDNIGIDLNTTCQLATTVYKEVSELSGDKKLKIKNTSPVPINDRLNQVEQSIAFNAICSTEAFKLMHGLAYAHTVTLSYIGIVYLAEPLFDVLRKVHQKDSATNKCSNYLRNNPVRAFRNSLAHGNWRINSNGSAIDFWAREGATKVEPMKQWEVLQSDLVFWYSLSRTIGYAALSACLE